MVSVTILLDLQTCSDDFYVAEGIYFSSRLYFSCLGFLDFSYSLFCRVLRRIYKSLLNKKNCIVGGSNPRQPYPQSIALTIRPRERSLRTTNFRIIIFSQRKSIHAINGTGNLYKARKVTKTCSKSKSREKKRHSCFVFL